MKKTFLLSLILSLLPCTSFALNSDKQQPLNLQSDTAILNHKTGVSIYHGHVKLTQGTTIVTADTLTVYVDAHSEINKAVATGSAENPASYSTLPDNSKLRFIATALTINYFPVREWAEFIDQAKAMQGQDSYSGPQLNYDIKNEIVVSPSSPSGRATIIVQPDQKEN